MSVRSIRDFKPRMMIGVLVGLLLGAMVLLWPVLFSPVTADDRYWFIEVPAESDMSVIEVIRITIDEIPAWLETGRVTPLAFLARRVMLLTSFRFSAATSTPLVATQGIAKLFLLVVGIGSCLAFVRALRWRTSDERLVKIGARRLTVIGGALIAVAAVGAQAHTQFRNGWISYPVLTYGAVTVVFLSGALVAYMTRRISERRPWAVPIGIVSMVLLGIGLNISYELYYVAFPLALAVLMLFPYSNERRDPAAMRARTMIGGTLGLSFIGSFLLIRQLIAARCATAECYVGTRPSLGRGVLGTWSNNLFSSVPGLSHERFVADLEELGALSRWPDPSIAAVVIVSVLVAGSVILLWRLVNDADPASEADREAERRLLLATSVSVLGVAIGAALIMSVSVQAQEVIESVGYPYRHTVLTWVALSLALVTLAVGLSLTSSPARRLIPIVIAALLMFLVSFSLPRNLVSNQEYRNLPSNRAIADIHWEVVAGDRSESGDERRCQSLERAEASINNPWLTERLEPAADQIFRRLNNLPYCSTWSET